MTTAWATASALSAAAGAVATPALTVNGMAQLARHHTVPGRLKLLNAVAGCGAGVVAILVAHQAGNWWILPGLLVWACTLVAAAACDASTRRVPTALVRRAGVGTGVLLIAGLALRSDWRGLLLSAATVVAGGSALLLCWRFAGAGFGDVRLATLGGLGLGHATSHGAVVGFFVFCVITLFQIGVALARGGNRHTDIPLGPGLATALLAAAAV